MKLKSRLKLKEVLIQLLPLHVSTNSLSGMLPQKSDLSVRLNLIKEKELSLLENSSEGRLENLLVFNLVKEKNHGLNKVGKKNKDQNEDPEENKRYCRNTTTCSIS